MLLIWGMRGPLSDCDIVIITGIFCQYNAIIIIYNYTAVYL